VTFNELVKGERAFREEYTGELSVEVFIGEGINSQRSNVQRIAEIVKSIHPDRVDINTAVRPPTVAEVSATSEEHLKGLADLFGEKASVTATFKKQGFASMEISEEVLLGLIKRHPATCGQLADEFNLPEDRMRRMLDQMVENDLLKVDRRGDDTYYFLRG
jgi:wyosine [tRNA(Phe)-imidazoG37] synthetase (radical SAM superfamily)